MDFNDHNPISNVTSMVSQLGWKPLTESRRKHRPSLLYKIINGLVVILQIHTYILIQETHEFVTQTIHLHDRLPKTLSFPSTIRDWNLSPDEVVNCKNLSTFKEHIGHVVRMSDSAYTGRWFEPRQRQYVVSLSKHLI